MDADAVVESSLPIGESARPREATLGDVEAASRVVRPSRNVARLVARIAGLVAAIAVLSAAAVLHLSNKADRDELRKRLALVESELQSAAAGNQHTAEQLLAARTELSQTNTALGKAHGDLEASAGRESKLAERLAEAKGETDAARAAERQARLDSTIDRQQQVDQLDYLRRVGLAYAAWRDGQMYVARRALAECPAQRRHWEWQFVDRLWNSELSRTAVTNDQGLAFDVGWTRTAQVGLETTVKVQHKNAPEKDRLLKGHATAVRGIAFSLDGTRIATVSNDRMVKVWNSDTGEEIKTLAAAVASRDTVLSFRFVGIDARGSRVASSGANEGLIRAWDVESGREIFSTKAYVHGLDLSPDGTRIAGTTMGSIKVWDVGKGTETLSLEWPGQAAQALAFSPDGKRLAVARDGHIKLWDVTTGKPVLTLEGHRYVLRLAFSRDGKQLGSVGDRTMRIWDVTVPQEVGMLGRYLDHLSFSPDGHKIAGSSYADHGVVIQDAETGKDIRIIKPTGFQVMRVAFSPDWKRAALMGYGTLAIWDVESGKELLTLIAPPELSLPGRPPPPRGDPGGAKAPMPPAPASPKADKPLLVGKKPGLAAGASRREVQNVQSMAFSPDGKQLVIADHSVVQLWDVEAGREIRELNRGKSRPVVLSPKGLRDLQYSPSLVAFAPHGKRIATAGGNQVKLWDPATGVELISIGAQVERFTCLTFSPNGERVVAGSSDGLIKIWNTEDGQPVLTLLGHTQDVLRLSFHPDGTRLVSAGRDGTIKVWDTGNGLEALTLLGHTKAVDNVAFSPDGLRIASSSHDNTLRIWDARPRNWRAESLPPK
jgi:WD40 repeat protein